MMLVLGEHHRKTQVSYKAENHGKHFRYFRKSHFPPFFTSENVMNISDFSHR